MAQTGELQSGFEGNQFIFTLPQRRAINITAPTNTDEPKPFILTAEYEIPEGSPVGFTTEGQIVRWMRKQWFRQILSQPLPQLLALSEMSVGLIQITNPLHPTHQRVAIALDEKQTINDTPRHFLIEDFENALNRIRANKPLTTTKPTEKYTTVEISGLRYRYRTLKKGIEKFHCQVMFRASRRNPSPHLLTLAYALHKLNLGYHIRLSKFESSFLPGFKE